MRDTRIHYELLYDIIGKRIQEEKNITPHIEDIYVGMMDIIVVKYTFYNENGARILGQLIN